MNNLIELYYNLKEHGVFSQSEIIEIEKSIIKIDPKNLESDTNDYDDNLFFKNQELKIIRKHEVALNKYNELSNKGKFIFIDAKPEMGFNFGFMMYIPNNVNLDTTLMMHCCNTPSGSGVKNIAESIQYAIDCNINDDFLQILSLESGLPYFMPIIPRVNGFNMQIHNNYVENGDRKHLDIVQRKNPKKYQLTESEKEMLILTSKNLEDQIEKMSLCAKEVLASLGINVSDKIIIEGYSVGSIFATRFANAKPDLVGATIIGGNSGYEEVLNKEILKSYYNGGLDDNNSAELIEIDDQLISKYDDTFSYEDKIRMKEEYDNAVPNKEINQNIYQIKKQEQRLSNQTNTIYKVYDKENHSTVLKKAIDDQINFAKNASSVIINNQYYEKNSKT